MEVGMRKRQPRFTQLGLLAIILLGMSWLCRPPHFQTSIM
jgi:hypothetical protein